METLRQALYFALIALSGCIAVTTAHSQEAPRSVQYLDAGLAIALDAGYFTSSSVSLEYTNNLAALNWEATIGNEIGTNVDLQVIVQKKIGVNCSSIVYDSGRRSFCKSVPQKVRSYVNALLGFDLASPPVLRCPFAPGPYVLRNYRPHSSRLDENIEKGQLAVFYEFSVNKIMIIRYTVDVIVS